MDNHGPSWIPCAIHNSLAWHWRPSVFPPRELWRWQHLSERISWKLYQWCGSTLWMQALVYVCFLHGENVGEVFVVQEKQLAWFLCNLQGSRWVFEKSKWQQTNLHWTRHVARLAVWDFNIILNYQFVYSSWAIQWYTCWLLQLFWS